MSHWTQRIKPREARLLVATLILFSFWVYINQMARPLYKSTQELKQMIQAKEVKLARDRRAINRNATLEKAFESLGSFDRVSEAEAAMRKNKLIQTIEATKRQVGVHLENLNPVEPKIFNEYTMYRVKIEVDDRMENLLRFILELKKPPARLNLQNMKLKASTQKEKSLRASFIVGKLFILENS
jgi:Tfp pilus assembly protein PilO